MQKANWNVFNQMECLEKYSKQTRINADERLKTKDWDNININMHHNKQFMQIT